MSDPFRSILGMGNDSSQYHVDTDRITKEEFEAASILSSIIWGPDGFAECLGPTWNMVHDPRFVEVERLGVRERKGRLGGNANQGIGFVDGLDIRPDGSGSKIVMIDDLEIYAEVIGEGRHMLEAALRMGMTPEDILEKKKLRWRLIERECPNYQMRNGDWNWMARRLEKMLAADLLGLIRDYADTALSQDWIRMDTQEVVVKGHPGSDEVPTVAVEIDTIQRALTMRAQVRLTAYRILAQYPGLKPEEFDAITFTDDEADQLVQILFKAESMDKLYTVIPRMVALVNAARTKPLTQRLSDGLARLKVASKIITDGLKDGSIDPITTPIETPEPYVFGAPDPESKSANEDALAVTLLTSNSRRALFEAIQMYAEDEDQTAKSLVEQLQQSGSADSIWRTIIEYLTTKHTEEAHVHTKAAVGASLEAKDVTPRPTLVVREVNENYNPGGNNEQ